MKRVLGCKTPKIIKDHFSSKENKCRYLVWRLYDYGITAHFVCCKQDLKNVKTLLVLSWTDIDPSWKEASLKDFPSVVKLLCGMIQRRIEKLIDFEVLDSMVDICSGESNYWGAEDLELNKLEDIKKI